MRETNASIKTKPVFDLEDYKGNYLMMCETEEEAIEFCNLLHDDGRKWCQGNSYAEVTYWGERDPMPYAFNKGQYDGSGNYQRSTDFVILYWKDFSTAKSINYNELKEDLDDLLGM